MPLRLSGAESVSDMVDFRHCRSFRAAFEVNLDHIYPRALFGKVFAQIFACCSNCVLLFSVSDRRCRATVCVETPGGGFGTGLDLYKDNIFIVLGYDIKLMPAEADVSAFYCNCTYLI